MPTSSISSKWQVTIPKLIREDLGIESYDKLMFVKTGVEEYKIRPIKRPLLADLHGVIKHQGPPLEFDKLRQRMKKYVAARAFKRGRLRPG